MATVSGINGVKSSILELDPFYSGMNGTGTNSTVMLNIGASKWAQLGWFKSKIDGNVVRRETGLEFFLDLAHNYWRWYGARPVQTSTEYEILFDPNNGNKFDFFVAGSYWLSFSGFVPTTYELFSETHDLADQMPGVASNVEVFQASGYWTGLNHANYHVMTSAISTDNDTIYGGQRPADGKYYAWDKCIIGNTAVITSTASATPDSGAASASVGDPTLLPEDIVAIGLGQVVDRTSAAAATTNPASVAGISKAAAMKVAGGEIVVAASSRAYTASVRATAGGPVIPVWVITAAGGVPFFDGPPGATVPDPRISGAIVDASTGEFIGGFME